MKVEIRGVPPIGSTLSLDAQVYELRGVRQIVRDDGVSRRLLWRSTCPTCGEGFDVETSGMGTRPVRRCAPCRSAKGMVPVNGYGRKVVAVLQLPEASA